MDIETIKAKIRQHDFIVSAHADQEAADENISIAEICTAILNDEILEHYPDTGRGKSCLVLGFANKRPIHVVCGWRHKSLLIITVYIPSPPHFENPRTRRR
jgi:hypothetical protein